MWWYNRKINQNNKNQPIIKILNSGIDDWIMLMLYKTPKIQSIKHSINQYAPYLRHISDSSIQADILRYIPRSLCCTDPGLHSLSYTFCYNSSHKIHQDILWSIRNLLRWEFCTS